GKTNYILANEASGVGFYKAATSGAYLTAHRAYLSTATAAGAREFLSLDDETTGISAALKDNGEMTNDKAFFNLNGQRVAQPTRGLYIVNGRKVVVK
ncbi:MAG: hypothetical protein IJ709_02415, partial [Selenomonas sp.]|nr:hypothetical protein [Selenomonas sp.]